MFGRTVAVGFLVVLLASSVAAGAPQENATNISECNPDAKGFEGCLREHTTEQDVLKWIQQDPESLTENQVSAVFAFNTSDAFDEDVRERINDWKMWSSGAEKPDWFNTGDGPDEPKSVEGDNSNTTSESVNESDVTKYREIRDGQWFVEEPKWYDNGTGKARIYSEFDGKVAFVDNGDCEGDEKYCQPDVVQSDVSGGNVTTVWFEASVMEGTFGKPDQKVTFNSLIGPQGEYNLALASLSDKGSHLFEGDPIWDYVWMGVLSAIFTLGGVALATYAYIYWSSRRLEINLFRYLREEL